MSLRARLSCCLLTVVRIEVLGSLHPQDAGHLALLRINSRSAGVVNGLSEMSFRLVFSA